MLGQPGLDVGVLVGGVVVQDQMHVQPCRPLGVNDLRNLRNSVCRCFGRQDPITLPVSTSKAANNVRHGRRDSSTARSWLSTWTATSPQIVKLRDHLLADRVELVVMESTSDNWRPFFYLLSEGLSVILVKASDVRALPGRKSDVSDSEWPVFLSESIGTRFDAVG